MKTVKTVIDQKYSDVFDSAVAAQLIRMVQEGQKEELVPCFLHHCDSLGDYAYWALLSYIWENREGTNVNPQTWRNLFSSERKRRFHAIMRHQEQYEFNQLSYIVQAYRVIVPGETDWIDYTLSMRAAKANAEKHSLCVIDAFKIHKRDMIAYYPRNSSHEIIVLNREDAVYQKTLMVKGAQMEEEREK